MRTVVERWADGSRDGQMRGALAVVRMDELGHRGMAAALDQLWSVRAKDGGDFRRLVEFARTRVITSPSAPADIGCRCDAPVAPARKVKEGTRPPENGPQNPQNQDGETMNGGSEGFEGGSPGEWDAFASLPGRVEPLPVEALGPVLRPVVEAIGTALQVPTDLPANLALPLVTTAAAGRWEVEVDVGWREPLCLATLSALLSGELKTPTLKVLDVPLREFERGIQQATRGDRSEQAAKKKLAEDRMNETRKAAVKAPAADRLAEGTYLEAVAEFEKIEVDPVPRLLADDATPEAAVSLLADHGSIGLVSDEPGLFGILAGRYSGGAPTIEWFLKATSGSPIKVDRKGRDPEDILNPALSAACCIQPGRLIELGTIKAFRDSGFLARWLFVVPTSTVGARGATSPVDPDAVKAWAEHVTAVAEAAQKHHGEPKVLRIDDGGRAVLMSLRAELEPHLHPDHGRYAGIADWCNKLVGTCARIAGALTLLSNPAATVISAGTVADAVQLGRAYVSHAIAAFALTRPNGETFSRARQVLGMIRKLADDEGRATERDVHQKLRDRAWVEDRDTLEPLLVLLTEFGHIRRHDGKRPAGGRPSPFIELHPDHRTTNHPKENQT